MVCRLKWDSFNVARKRLVELAAEQKIQVEHLKNLDSQSRSLYNAFISGQDQSVDYLQQILQGISDLKLQSSTKMVQKEGAFMVPFDRDPQFVARGNIMQTLEQNFENRGRQAICGMGGIG